MVQSFDEVAGMAGRHSLNLRIGAYMLAIERVATVHRLRGMYA
jgi:glutamate dehydrogenase (NAD(P)+)